MRLRLGIVFVFGLVVLAACNGASPGPTPAPGSPAPAFQMIALREVPCPASLGATLCEEARIKNIGDEAGDGSCRLRAHETTTDGEDRAVFGEPTEVTGVAPGAESAVILPWSKPKPTDPFTVDCEPGPSL